MTETEWLACDNPALRLLYLPWGVSQRKQRLIAAACCRRSFAPAYEERCQKLIDVAERFGVLADALEEAGCPEQELLAHCRNGGEHWRGCFAIDVLLGKS
jgi:hypothetical protein